MKTFKEYINEDRETAKNIRELIKKELKLSTKDVSVRAENGGYSSSAVNVTIKSFKALEKMTEIKNIANSEQSVDRDDRTGEILAGGNTFVFIDIDYKFKTKIFEKIQKDYEEALKKSKEDVVKLYKSFTINNSNGEKYIFAKKRSLEVKDENYIGSCVIGLIKKIGDDKLYKEIS